VGKFCTGASDFDLANCITAKAGLTPIDLGPAMDTCVHCADGVNDECEGCGKLIRKGEPIFWQDGPPEYPHDGSVYGSLPCASSGWAPYPGTWQWFLECLGWELDVEDDRFEGRKGRYQRWWWVLREPLDDEGESPHWPRRSIIAVGSVGANNGPGPSFRKALALARKLAKEFRRQRRAPSELPLLAGGEL